MATSVNVKGQAHALIDYMAPGQISAVVGLLEATLDRFSRALANAPIEAELASDDELATGAASRV